MQLFAGIASADLKEVLPGFIHKILQKGLKISAKKERLFYE
jgi:hypothetical protein